MGSAGAWSAQADFGILTKMMAWLQKRSVGENVEKETHFPASEIFGLWPKDEPGYEAAIAPRQKMGKKRSCIVTCR